MFVADIALALQRLDTDTRHQHMHATPRDLDASKIRRIQHQPATGASMFQVYLMDRLVQR